MAVLQIKNVHLPFDDVTEEQNLYTVLCKDGKVDRVIPESGNVRDASAGIIPEGDVLHGGGGLLLPSLCHSHIHLDKCYILSKGPALVTGDFEEALLVTTRVKSLFASSPSLTNKTEDKGEGGRKDERDLIVRGDRLVRESVEAGVTAMRAHVEVDAIVRDVCVLAALEIKEKWKKACDVQLCVFMQDPLFDNVEDIDVGENARYLVDVLSRFHGEKTSPSPSILTSTSNSTSDGPPRPFSAIGSAPYVERTRTQQLANIAFVISLARRYGLHVDFHLDYDLTPLPASSPNPASARTPDPDSKPGSAYNPDHNPNTSAVNSDMNAEDVKAAHPLIWSVLDALERTPPLRPDTVVTIGHATRLTLFPARHLRVLRARIAALPCAVHFVGLPQSDVYMMGRRVNQDTEAAYDPPRGTLDVVRLREVYGLNTAMAVNNVGNAFTPQGAPDPLSLCPLGVAVYQDGTRRGCRTLIEAITTASKRAIGLPGVDSSPLLVPREGFPADFVLLHGNATLQDAALSPSYDRTTIKTGRVVAWRRSRKWNAL